MAAASISGFEQRIAQFKESIPPQPGYPGDKHALVLHAANGEVNNDYLQGCFKKMADLEDACDFFIISLIRFLYLGKNTSEEVVRAKSDIEHHLSLYPFWPAPGKLAVPFPEKLIFWSENHALMLLSSSHLHRQRTLFKTRDDYDGDREENTDKKKERKHDHYVAALEENLMQHHETVLLVSYLEAHCSHHFNGGGVYEVLSPTYLPYTLAALFNLYDFSINERIKQCAKIIIDAIVTHLMLCTTVSNGICTLAPSARAYRKTRLTIMGHNINNLMTMLTGVEPGGTTCGNTPSSSSGIKASQITDFITTTSWRPSAEMYKNALLRRIIRVKALPISPSIDAGHHWRGQDEDHLYPMLSQEEVTPLYWSAGLVMHPQFVRATRAYLSNKGMGHNQHLWPLRLLSQNSLHSVSNSYSILTEGQQYTGIKLNVFKNTHKGLILSSFERFNAHICGYQQLPWIAAVDGLPVWTQSGRGSSGVFGFGITNTHNPCVSQAGSLAVITYAAPHTLTATFGVCAHVFGYKTRLFWPEGLLDEHYYISHNNNNNSSGGGGGSGGGGAVIQDYSTVYGARNDVEVAKDREQDKRSKKESMTGELYEDHYIPPFTWSVARKGSCLIAVLCTQASNMDRSSGDPDALLNVSREKPATCRQSRSSIGTVGDGIGTDSTPTPTAVDGGGGPGGRNNASGKAASDDRKESEEEAEEEEEEDEKELRTSIRSSAGAGAGAGVVEVSGTGLYVRTTGTTTKGQTQGDGEQEEEGEDDEEKDDDDDDSKALGKKDKRMNSKKDKKRGKKKKERYTTYNMPRRYCNEYRHSWIVVVGTLACDDTTCSFNSAAAADAATTVVTATTTTEKEEEEEGGFPSEYSSLADFVNNRCLKLKLKEVNGGSASAPSVFSGFMSAISCTSHHAATGASDDTDTYTYTPPPAPAAGIDVGVGGAGNVDDDKMGNINSANGKRQYVIKVVDVAEGKIDYRVDI